MSQLNWNQTAAGLLAAIAVQAQAAPAAATPVKDPAAQLAQDLTRDLKTVVAYQEGQGTRANCVAAQNRIELAEVKYRGQTEQTNMISNTKARMREGVVPVTGSVIGPICPVTKPQGKPVALKR